LGYENSRLLFELILSFVLGMVLVVKKILRGPPAQCSRPGPSRGGMFQPLAEVAGQQQQREYLSGRMRESGHKKPHGIHFQRRL
jgi:hypothetical protein